MDMGHPDMNIGPVNAAPANVAPEHGEPVGVSICGIIALVLGTLALVLSFVPIINNAAAILGVVGAVLAVIGLVGTLRGRKRGKALTIVAAVLSVLAIVITLAMQASFSKALDDAVGGSSSQTGAKSGGSGSADAKSGDTQSGGASADKQSDGPVDTEGDLGDFHVRIVSAVASDADYEGKPTVLITYEWTNNGSGNNSFAALAHPQAFQNGHELGMAVYAGSPQGYDANSYLAEVQPGATATVTMGYVLENDTEVTVEVSRLLSMNGKTKVTHTFALQ